MKVLLSRKVRAAVSSKAIILTGMLMVSPPVLQAANNHFPKGEAILDKHVETTGGKAAHLKLKSRRKTGKFEADIAGHMLKAKIVESSQAPNKSHLRFDGSPMTMVRVCNGKEAWEWNPGHRHDAGEKATASQLKEQTRLLSGPQKTRTLKAAQFHRTVEWRKYIKSAKTIGVTDVKGKPAYEVKITPKKGKPVSQFYDKQSGRLVKYVRSAESEDAGAVAMEVFLSDYRKFDGVWIATKVTQHLNSPSFGKGTQTWTYDKIEHNVKIPASLFAMPEGLKATKEK